MSIKTIKIQSISTPRETETTKAVVVITTTGGQVLIRNPKQFLQDLENSGFISNAKAMNIRSMAVRRTIQKLIGGTASGEIAFHLAGSTYVVDENATAYKNGDAEIGDSVERETSGLRVEDGFLTLEMSYAKQQMQFNAEAHMIASEVDVNPFIEESQDFNETKEEKPLPKNLQDVVDDSNANLELVELKKELIELEEVKEPTTAQKTAITKLKTKISKLEEPVEA